MKLALSGTLEALLEAKAARLGISPQEALRMLAVQWVQGEAPAAPARDPHGTLPGTGGTFKEGESLSGEGEEEEQEDGFQVVEQLLRKEARRKARARPNDDPPGFPEFWAAYPRKQKRGDARKAWLQVAKVIPPLPVVLGAIEEQRGSPQWQRENGQFIPYPASWLRGECWGDCATVLPFAPPDPELAWRVEEVWASRVYAYREYQRQNVGVAPSVDPVLTPALRGLIEQAIRTFDGNLGAQERAAWRRDSIARAAGIGHFYSAWHIGEDPKAPGMKQLGHDLPWRNGNTQRFADLYFETRDLSEAAERARR